MTIYPRPVMYTDPEADAAYIKIKDADVHRTAHVLPDVLLDYDEAGKLIGIELLAIPDTVVGAYSTNPPAEVT